MKFLIGLASRRGICGFRNPKRAYSNCHVATALVVRLACEAGFSAHAVRLEGESEWLRDNSLSRNKGLNPYTRWVHHVARVEDVYADFTARQFDPEASFPLLTTDAGMLTEHWEVWYEPYEFKSDPCN